MNKIRNKEQELASTHLYVTQEIFLALTEDSICFC